MTITCLHLHLLYLSGVLFIETTYISMCCEKLTNFVLAHTSSSGQLYFVMKKKIRKFLMKVNFQYNVIMFPDEVTF